ncbi:DNA-protecting protein DprA [Coraliomargarita sinensis]|uniref:DNA-protecting protein DprA n=1 Tax=Coraliomargarita sinensis TaxID=2174842 RepID=A0A317ZJA9_9BACT|nr:DNA-processing protein DprA [Coraliomargarita sinensis]PXA05676.1 DNA-protecting protein DprA [Coraliomargarita sinensis]
MSGDLSSNDALIILNGLPHVGPVMLRHLMDEFANDPVAVLTGDKSKLLRVKGVGEKAADVLINWPTYFDLEKEKQKMATSGIRFVDRWHPDYPDSLGELYDPPIGLYVKGEYTVDRPCVAIVGTRRATLYGRKVAKRFGAELARMGFCVVSGMARGTDTAAHEGALEAGGPTVAVFGCGMDIIYPPENLELSREIMAKGALLSEFPFGRRADRQTFPMRNRVVAGMCEAVIVVESAVAGGSMITARFAGEQGRQVMAVPGRIDQSSSEGCHQLIRDGATMVTSVDHVLEELRYRRPEQMEASFEPAAPDLDERESTLMELFAGGEVLAPDQIADRLQWAYPEVAAILMGLEIKRLVCKRSDGVYEGT